MKKKILFVITKSNFGGAQKYVYDLARNLPAEQFEVAVTVGGTGSLVQKLKEQNIRVISTSSLSRDINTKSDLTAFFELLKILRKENPDVVHLNSAKAGGVGALAARIAGVPKIIFTAHGWAFNEDRPHYQRVIIKFFSWLTVFFSHQTIAVSDAIKRDTLWWPLVQDKVIVIKNGIAVPDFYSKNDARKILFSKTRIAIPPDANIISTIAELHKSKGLEYSINAFAKIATTNPSLYYFIIGEGSERASLEKSIKNHNLEERIFLVGFVENAACLLPAFDIFVLPSITEALGFVLLEAGLAKLPVVATRTGGIPEIVDGRTTGLLVEVKNSAALADALTKILSGGPTTKELGNNLHNKVIVEFSLSRAISETISLYTGK